MPKNNSGAEKLTKAEATGKALQLRKAGLDFRTIGQRLGIAHTTAHKYVHQELDKLKDQNSKAAEDYRTLNMQRLESLLTPVYQKALGGDLGASEKARKIIHDLSTLVGAEAPKKIASTTSTGEDTQSGIIVVPAVSGSVEEWLEQYGPKDQ